MAAGKTRAQIVEVADRLFYERGYEHTSFADIAAEVQISRGNFYYHFRTKDEILDAVIRRRLESTQAMLDGWEAEGAGPVERITSFIQILIVNQTKIMAFGCPVGTLTSELAKLGHASQAGATGIFSMFRHWLAQQFTLMGHEAGEADRLAMQLLARSQGVATLASAFHDKAFVEAEVQDMCAWLDAQAPDPTRLQ